MQEITKEKDNNKEGGVMDIYEIGYHIVPTMSEADLALEVEKIKSLITNNSGEIVSEEMPEIKTLAYSISKRMETKNVHYEKAYFGWVKFVLDSSLIEGLKEAVDTDQNILRFIIVKTVKENTIFTPKSQIKKEVEKNDELISEPVVEVQEVVAEELDKTIEDLVIS